MSVKYRKLELSDLDAFIKMNINLIQEVGIKTKSDLKVNLYNYYIKHINDNTFIAWIAFDDKELVGTGGISFVEKPPYLGTSSEMLGLLSGIYVLKSYRRKGIAKELLRNIIHEAEQYGCNTVEITGSDAGVLLYEDFGFQRDNNFMYYKVK